MAKHQVTKHVLFWRGLYARVAKRLKLDESFVNRVANGQRSSEKVERALDREVAKGAALGN